LHRTNKIEMSEDPNNDDSDDDFKSGRKMESITGSFSVASIDSSHNTIVSSSIDPMATYQDGLNEMKIFDDSKSGRKMVN